MSSRPTNRPAGTLATLFREVVRDHFGLTPREQAAAWTVAGLLLLGVLARCVPLRGGLIR